MNSKIIQLAQSPVILSESDMQNFIKLMELPTRHIDILKDAKQVIKNYYINNIVNIEDEELIDNALLLVQGQKIEEGKALVQIDTEYRRQTNGQIYILKEDGLTLKGNSYPTYNYNHSLDLIKDSKIFQIVNNKKDKSLDLAFNRKNRSILLNDDYEESLRILQDCYLLTLFAFSPLLELLQNKQYSNKITR